MYIRLLYFIAVTRKFPPSPKKSSPFAQYIWCFVIGCRATDFVVSSQSNHFKRNKSIKQASECTFYCLTILSLNTIRILFVFILLFVLLLVAMQHITAFFQLHFITLALSVALSATFAVLSLLLSVLLLLLVNAVV